MPYLSPARTKKIFDLGMPIVAGMVSQNIFNLVDTMMVGRLGPEPLAAVGTAGMMTFTFGSVIFGVTSGVQAVAARFKGEGKLDKTATALNTGLVFALASSVLVMLLACFVSKPMFELLCGNHQVAMLADEYFMIRMSVCFLMVANFAFRGYWNAIDQSRIYMNSLVMMNLLNIVLNYLLIFGNFGFPKLGVNGSALSTAIATAFGAVFYFYVAYRDARPQGFLSRIPSLQELILMTKISLASSSETVLTMLNVAVMYWVAGKISAYALAGINILMNMLLVVYLPAIALGITLATLAGQALGRGDKDDAYNWGIDMMKLGVIICFALAIPYLLFPEMILRLFTQSQEVISISVDATRIMGITLGVEVIAFIFLDALKGLGYATKPMLITAGLNWCLYVPSICILVFVCGQGLFAIWFMQSLVNFILAFWFYRIWLSRKWQLALG